MRRVELRPASTRKSQALQRRLHSLVVQRQRLRDEHVPLVALEQNRIDIVRTQLELSHALVSERGPGIGESRQAATARHSSKSSAI
jgi:hypothetical protein